MVFPIAIFLSQANAGRGNFGAEYKKVSTTATNIHLQFGSRYWKYQAAPTAPKMISPQFNQRCCKVHFARMDSFSETGVSAQ